MLQDRLCDGQRVEVRLAGGVLVSGRVRLVGERVVLVPDSEVPAFGLGPGALVRVVE